MCQQFIERHRGSPDLAPGRGEKHKSGRNERKNHKQDRNPDPPHKTGTIGHPRQDLGKRRATLRMSRIYWVLMNSSSQNNSTYNPRMSRECAFCRSTAKLTGEHLWSDWMNDLFPGRKHFTMRDKHGKFSKKWRTAELDWTAKVVCEPCNGGWMSKIENEHAKPAMTDLIRGTGDITISKSIARSIALFAFKTAVVFDHMQKERGPFFHRIIRDRFRESCEISPTIRMWMTAYSPSGSGAVHTCYHEGRHTLSGRIELYICTYAVGHFVFQVCAERGPMRAYLTPRPDFEDLAIPFWPSVPKETTWPPPAALSSAVDFHKFSIRWNEVEARLLTGGR